MRKSITRLMHVPPGGSKFSFVLLALFLGLATSTPSTAQDAPPEKAVHAASYAAYSKETPPVKDGSDKVTIPLKVSPNPTTGSFRAMLRGSKEERVRVEILDRYGRIIDAREVSAQTDLRFGYWYHPGTYYLHIIQGDARRKVKLVKVVE